MNIITIGREFGSGGRELGEKLAELLSYDYYDSRIITAIADNKGLSADYVEKTLDNYSSGNVTFAFASTFSMSGAGDFNNIDLLVEQAKVVKALAEKGRDMVIVGRNADVYLAEYQPINIFVCADMSAKLERCRQRAKQGENLSDRQLARKIKSIDKNRKRMREFVGGNGWGDPHNYNLTVNTTCRNPKELAKTVAIYVRNEIDTKR
ncbi:MAG: AAA family ATPase [Christensenellales bacterium]